jgi:lipid-A-disaccharide synthase
MALRFFLIAGEPSGDRLGAALMAGLKTLEGDVEFHGVGGPLMAAEGLQSLFPMDRLSVFGLAEVLPKLRELFALKDQAARAVLDLRPDALITIDSPDFCLRVAKQVKAGAPDLRCIHYVAPSVWAWRPKRAAKMARHIDHVLALLPFEPPYMEAAGMSCDFVGHPVVAEPQASADETAAFRAAHDIAPDAPLLLVLPGSRRSEITRLAPVFGQAIAPLLAAQPDLCVVLPTLAHIAPLLPDLLAGWPVAPLVLDPTGLSSEAAARQKRGAFAAADLALAASGTVSLELAAAATPLVIAYDMNRLTWALMRRAALIDTVTLVNLVSDTRVIPEFLGPACQPEAIGAALVDLATNPAARAAQAAAMATTMARIGQGGEAPGLRAARSVLAYVRR